MKIPPPNLQRAKLFVDGKLVGNALVDVEIDAIAQSVKQHIVLGVQQVSVQMNFTLQPTEDPLPGLRKLCADVVHRYFDERMRDYELHVDDTTEPHVAHERSSFLVRIVPRGSTRSIGNMSFNYQHRHIDQLGKVRTRLLTRLEAYCKRILPRLRTPEQLAASAARRAAAEANRPGLVRKAMAKADAAFAELEKDA